MTWTIMRTTISLEKKIFEDLMAFTDARTKTEAVNRAVAEWVRRKRIDRFRALRGKITWEGDIQEIRNAEIQESEETHG